MKDVIRIDHVWKEFTLGDTLFQALKDITLSIQQGEFASIVGPSGSGKSTLMHIIGLLDTPTRGTITIDGKDIARMDDNQLSQLRNRFVGFVFQQFNLIPKLTILENIVMPTMYARLPLTYDPYVKAMDLITRFGLKGKENSFPNKISGGQQQRVAIARALIMNPQLLLADEPTGNLDSKTGQEILALLESLHEKDGVTVVIVTHDPSVAARADRHIQIVDGKIA